MTSGTGPGQALKITEIQNFAEKHVSRLDLVIFLKLRWKSSGCNRFGEEIKKSCRIIRLDWNSYSIRNTFKKLI